VEGDSPVHGMVYACIWCVVKESGCSGMQPKVGGIFHLKLNTGKRPIANKYREGKMKRTLKRELKVREIAKREAFGISVDPVESAFRVKPKSALQTLIRSTAVAG